MKTITKLWILLSLLCILAPLGLVIPKIFRSTAAWGEWGPDELGRVVGYIPQGLASLVSVWRSPIPGYAPAGARSDPGSLSVFYILSAVAGVMIIAALIFLLGKLLARKD